MTGSLLLIPDPDRLSESCALADAYGAAFEYNDFFQTSLLDDEAALNERILMYRSLPRDRSRDTLHGSFYDIVVSSSDKAIREASQMRVRQSLCVARTLGVRGVVFHTGTIGNFKNRPYETGWLSGNVSFWREVCEEYGDLQIWMENMFDTTPDLLRALAEQMADVPNFGVCLDYAHARVFGGDPGEWLSQLAPFIRHMHINDNDGLADLHLAVGKGVIDWKTFDAQVRSLENAPSVLVETTRLSRQKESLAYMEEQRIYPF